MDMKKRTKGTRAILTAALIAMLMLSLSLIAVFGAGTGTAYADGGGTPTNTDFGGGDGLTAATAFAISTPEQLALLGTPGYLWYSENDGATQKGYYFKLTRDIDLADYLSEDGGDTYENRGPGWNGGMGWEPIGNQHKGINTESLFMGHFDGSGYTISGFWSDRTSYVGEDTYAGLFGSTYKASIKNLTLATQTDKALTLLTVGGSFVGYADETAISNCVSLCDVIGGRSASGGIVGSATFNTKIEDCINAGKMESQTDATYSSLGGISGELRISSIVRCVNIADITHSASNSGAAGGIFGYTDSGNGTVNECVNTGTIRGVSAGGIYGALLQRGTIKITDCYNTGDVTASSYAGGIAGSFNANDAYNISLSITNAYNTGKVTVNAGGIAGGIFGSTTGLQINSRKLSISHSFYLQNETVNAGLASFGKFETDDPEAVTVTNSLPKCETELKDIATYTAVADANWNFATNWFLPDHSYPLLKALGADGNKLTLEKEFTYDGDPKSIVIKNNPYLWFDVEFEDHAYTDAGSYPVKPVFTWRLPVPIGENYLKADDVVLRINKGEQAAPAAPTLKEKTDNSITLNTIENAEYSINITSSIWQDSPEFTGLTPETAYVFYARLKETDNHSASPASPQTTIDTLPLYGISLDRYRFTFKATFASLSDSTLPVTVKNEGAMPTGPLSVGFRENPDDIFQVSKTTLDSLAPGETTDFVIRVPKNRERPVGTYDAIITISGDHNIMREFSAQIIVSKANAFFLDPGTLTATYGQTLADIANLPAGYSWVNNTKSVGNVLAEAASFDAIYNPDPDNYNDATGKISVTVNKANAVWSHPAETFMATYGQTLADLVLPSDYRWVEDTTSVGNAAATGKEFGAIYNPDPDNYNDVMGKISVTVNKANAVWSDPVGMFTAVYGQTLADVVLAPDYDWANSRTSVGGASATAKEFDAIYNPDPDNYNDATGKVSITVNKAPQSAPSSPELDSKNASGITLKAIPGAEYSKDGIAWQDSPVFTGLDPETAYTFYVRLKGTDNYEESPASAAVSFLTDALPKATVTVTGGTGGGTLTVGERITVTADAADKGKRFAGWSDGTTIVSGDEVYTFTVTAAVTLTAVYEDIPKSGGLSGGAIAGIVIASIVIVALAGFAIFWFAVKKRNLKDIKALFHKKNNK